jgi:transcriptional regulator with XRE-family HTH domain
MTQKDLGDFLGKTSAAISEIERAKVQINPVDLYKLSMLLNKPVAYFYGESFGDEEFDDLKANIRNPIGSLYSGNDFESYIDCCFC